MYVVGNTVEDSGAYFTVTNLYTDRKKLAGRNCSWNWDLGYWRRAAGISGPQINLKVVSKSFHFIQSFIHVAQGSLLKDTYSEVSRPWAEEGFKEKNGLLADEVDVRTLRGIQLVLIRFDSRALNGHLSGKLLGKLAQSFQAWLMKCVEFGVRHVRNEKEQVVFSE